MFGSKQNLVGCIYFCCCKFSIRFETRIDIERDRSTQRCTRVEHPEGGHGMFTKFWLGEGVDGDVNFFDFFFAFFLSKWKFYTPFPPVRICGWFFWNHFSFISNLFWSSELQQRKFYLTVCNLALVRCSVFSDAFTGDLSTIG